MLVPFKQTGLTFDEVQNMNYMGVIETTEGEVHVVYSDTYLIVGDACNVGLLVDYVWERDKRTLWRNEIYSLDEELQEFVTALEEQGEIKLITGEEEEDE